MGVLRWRCASVHARPATAVSRAKHAARLLIWTASAGVDDVR